MIQSPSPVSLPIPQFSGPPPGFGLPPPSPVGFGLPPPSPVGFGLPPPPLLVRQSDKCYCEKCNGWDYETKEDESFNPSWTTKQIHSGQF